KQIEKIKILDPACGSGSFLLGAYQYLIDYHLKYYREHPKDRLTIEHPYFKRDILEEGLTIHEKARILRNNIFGVDIDPQAVEITMMSLYLKALEGERSLLPKKQHLLPPLSNNIKCGNSLIGYDIFDAPLFFPPSPSSPPIKEGDEGAFQAGKGKSKIVPSPLVGEGEGEGKFSDELKSRINPFDWNSKSAGFGEIMNPSHSPLEKGGSKGGFDVVIGNPPYVFTRDQGLTLEEKKYYYSHYKYQGAQLNTFGLFLEQSFCLLNKNGAIGFITPNNWLTIESFTELRKFYISQKGTLAVFNNLEKVFEAANVDTAIVIYHKGGNANLILGELSYAKEVFFKNLKPKLLSKQNYILSISRLKNEDHLKIINKIGENPCLGQLAIVSTGLKAYQTGKGKPKQKDFAKKERIFHSLKSKDKTYKKYLDGKDVVRYFLGWSGEYLSYGDWLAEPRRSVPFIGPRILVRQIPAQPPYCVHAIYTDDECLNDINSMVIFNIRDNYNYFYLLGILNSRLLSFWFQKSFDKLQRKIFPQFKVKELAMFPIRTINFNNPSEKAIHDKLVSLVDRMLHLHKKKNSLPPSAEREKIEREIAVTDEKIDDIVYGLYGITEDERKIIEGKE
ncbi:MAG: TaqI-like C-terminal specificity domain-containing protein, partial [Thermodesulfovibrionia bacterium]|nr:TaqI-like C-terminal specificity domain-containing protein [Thermodesulfovibrionia bacterium]